MSIFSGNPALKKLSSEIRISGSFERSTYKGISYKCLYFVLLTLFSAILSFVGTVYIIGESLYTLLGILLLSSVTTFICGFIAVLNPNATKIAGSIYAICQGLTMGFVALVFSAIGYSGVVFAALLATASTFLVMLLLYSSGIIRVGSGFKRFMLSAMISAIFINLIIFVLSLFSQGLHTLFYGSGALSIAISVGMVILASLMILFDLNRMTEIVSSGLEKKYEWVAAFGLLVTLIWLYTEFLKLLLKIAARRR